MTTTRSGGAKRQIPAASATLLAVRTSQPNSVKSTEGVRVLLSEPSKRMLGFRTILQIEHVKFQFVPLWSNESLSRPLEGIESQISGCTANQLGCKLHL